MKEEEKKLLIAAICNYLPYKPIIINKELSGGYPQKVFPGYLGLSMFLDSSKIDNTAIFLRPMSSMTEEEKKEVSILLNYEFYIDDDCALVAEDDRHRIRLDLMQVYIDWLNYNHFDYRGLIPMGLALEAPKDMYKI